MSKILLKIQRFFLSDIFQVVITFLFSGLLAGATLNWLVSLPAIERIIFFRDDTTNVMKFSGYLLFLLFLILPLLIGTFVSTRNFRSTQKHDFTLARCILACVFLGLALPLISLLCWAVPFFYGNSFFILPTFAFIFAFAMCFATRSLRLLPIAFFACVFSVSVAAIIRMLLYPLVREGSYEGSFIHLAPFFSSLSLCFGLWLQWQKARQRKDA